VTVSDRRGRGLWAALTWLVFPAIPVVLEDIYHRTLLFPGSGRLSVDPREWDWLAWLIQVGPLVGFGFLAGATLGVPDEPTTRWGPRAWLTRRATWVAVGPWAGFLALAALAWLYAMAVPYFPEPIVRAPGAVAWVVLVAIITVACYGWLVPAWAAIRRARRAGVAWASIKRGLAVSATFVGSLFGSFWAVTEWWRSFFFDPRVVPVLLAAASLGLLCGCSSTMTYGELRRRELFHSMLLAWTFGLALLWLWWGRTRKGPRDGP
jgi:hypothetical protein